MNFIKAASLVAVVLLGATAAKADALDAAGFRSESERKAHRVLEGGTLDKTSRILGGSGGTTANPALSQVERTRTQVQSILNNQATQNRNSGKEAEHQNTRKELEKLKSVLNEGNPSQNRSAGHENSHTTARSSTSTAASTKAIGSRAVNGGRAVAARPRTTR